MCARAKYKLSSLLDKDPYTKMLPSGPFPNFSENEIENRCFRFAKAQGEVYGLRIRRHVHSPFVAMDFMLHGQTCYIPAEISVVVINDLRRYEVMVPPFDGITFWFPCYRGFQVYYGNFILIYGNPGMQTLNDVQARFFQLQ